MGDSLLDFCQVVGKLIELLLDAIHLRLLGLVRPFHRSLFKLLDSLNKIILSRLRFNLTRKLLQIKASLVYFLGKLLETLSQFLDLPRHLFS